MSSSITFYNYPKSSRIISHHISSPQSPLSLIITWGGAPLEPINVPWSSHGISLEDDDHTALPLRTEVSPDRAPPDHLPVEDDDPCRARQHPSRTSGSCQILGLKCHDLLGYDFKTHGKSMNIVEHHGIHMVESGKMNCWNLEMDLVENIYISLYFHNSCVVTTYSHFSLTSRKHKKKQCKLRHWMLLVANGRIYDRCIKNLKPHHFADFEDQTNPITPKKHSVSSQNKRGIGGIGEKHKWRCVLRFPLT